MALRSRSALSPKQRKEISFWTSAAILALGCAVIAVSKLSSEDSAVYRRLAVAGGAAQTPDENLYPVDAILGSKPYDQVATERKFGIVVHLIGVCYMFLALNTVCDIYFTGALTVMVNEWKIKPDVAGATFMAAGGSAPEFFASLIGSVVTVNDVGFGTIVGSAVFNVLFVIGACGFVAPKAIRLSWWPLFRDCSYYIFGLSLLAVFASDQKIAWYEALILFLAYCLYCTIMYFNDVLAKKTDTEFMRRMTTGYDDEEATAKVAPADDLEAGEKKDQLRSSADSGPTEDQPGPPEHHRTVVEEVSAVEAEAAVSPAEAEENDVEPMMEAKSITDDESKEGKDGNVVEASTSRSIEEVKNQGPATTATASTGEGEEEEEEEDPAEEMMEIPESGKWRYFWFACCPVYFILYYGIPKPSEKTFIRTFLISLGWIALFSTCLIWWVEIMLGALGVDPIIQGFTILAAGTSIPDMASSVAVTRRGEGDMAVSSSIGSNIFDILVGLPVPWMIKIGLVEGIAKGNAGFMVSLTSEYLAFYVVLLLSMVFMVVVFIHSLGWRLGKMLGLCMGLLYVIFLVCAVGVEYGKPEWLRLNK